MADDTKETPATGDELGEGGKAALDAERTSRKAAEKDARDLKAELAQVKETLEERETKDMGELDKLRRDLDNAAKRADEAESESAEAKTTMSNLEKSGWVRAAAAEQGFKNPEDAVSFVSLGDLEDAKAAATAVKGVVDSGRDYLLTPKTTEEPAPGLTKILSNGQVAEEKTQQDQSQVEPGLAQLSRAYSQNT